MTTTRNLCRLLSNTLYVPGIERWAARLVRRGLLLCSGCEVSAVEAVMIRSGESLDQDSVENRAELEDISFEAVTDANARRKPSRDGEPDTQEQPAQGSVSGAQEGSVARGKKSGRTGPAQGEEGAGNQVEPSTTVSTDQTNLGAQTVIPGAERTTGREFVEAQAGKRVKGTKAQKPADEGLFDVAGRGQRELLSQPDGPSRSDLAGKDAIIVAVAPRRFSTQPSMLLRRRAARQDIRSLKGAHLNRDTGETIRIGAEGADKTTSGRRSALDLDVLSAMPKIIEMAVHVEAVTDRQAQPGVKAFHVFYGAARIEDQLARVRFVVREDQNGNFVYDSHNAEIKGPGVLAAGSVPPKKSSTLAGPPGPTTNVVDPLRGVKYEDRTPVVVNGRNRMSFNRRFAGGIKRIDIGLQALFKKLGIADKVVLRLVDSIPRGDAANRPARERKSLDLANRWYRETSLQ